MKRTALYILALTLAVIGAAPARAQAPTTMDEFKAVVLDSIQTGQALAVVESNIVDVTIRWDHFLKRVEAHQTNRCYFEPGHPEQCAAYDQEARNLQTEGQNLITEHDGYVAQRGFLTTHFGVNMARLRLAEFFGTFGPWVERVKNCSFQQWEVATKCLIDAWEEHP
ncbi:MAG: hypothetical protein WCT10_01575 [Patescibacteria group bacterium]|jgi:hypothetical protein